MWWRIITRSLLNQKIRQVLAILSIVLGTCLAAALVSLSLDIPRKAGSQLKAYGANILILPQVSPAGDETFIYEEDLSRLAREELALSISDYLPYLYNQIETDGQKVVMAGTWLDAVPKVSPWWQINGNWPQGRENTQDALVGSHAAEKLNLKLGDKFSIKYRESQHSFNVAGIVTTGAAEDNQVFVTLKAAQQLTGMTGKVGLVQVSARTQNSPLSQVSRLIEQNIPGTEARIIGQIARAESQVLYKVQLLMVLVAGLILVASGLVILSTMTTTILERTKEIGLMKALGASDRRIISFYGAEIGIIALGGGVFGYLLGYLLAQFIGQRVFNSSIAPSILAFLAALAVAILVAFIGSLLPLYRAMKVDPSQTLLKEE